MNLFKAEQEMYDLIHGYYLLMAKSEEEECSDEEREALQSVAHSFSRLYYHLEDELKAGYQAAAYKTTGGNLLVPRATRIARSDFPDRERRLREGRERKLQELQRKILDGRFEIVPKEKP